MSYIDPRGKVFAHLDRVVAWQQGRKVAPVTVEWDLSNRCVLGCQDCHFAHTHSRGPWVSRARTLPMAFDVCGDLASYAVVIRALGEMARGGVKAIVWSGGGEPTTHPQWMEILSFAKTMGLQQGMYTLGGLLTEQSARVLSDHAEWVVVSLDCPDADTYAAEKGVKPEAFERACNGVRWLSKGKAVVGVSFLLHEGNWTRADEMRELARELGATYVTFRPAVQTSSDEPSRLATSAAWVFDAMPTLKWLAEDAFAEIDPERFAQYRDWGGHGYSQCYGVRLNATVTPDGRMWLCPQRRGVRDSCLGDLTTESFADIWSRHHGVFNVNEGCRVMCRLHPVNTVLSQIAAPRQHEAFV